MLETNCNQMSAMQRNSRAFGNGNCGYNRNGNPNMNYRSGNPDWGKNDARNYHQNVPMKQTNGKNNVHCNTMQNSDDANLHMEVECVCKVATDQSCHMKDPMEKLGNRFPVAMAYVPWQQWGELYDAEYGLFQGTIFKDLNKIFCGVRC